MAVVRGDDEAWPESQDVPRADRPAGGVVAEGGPTEAGRGAGRPTLARFDEEDDSAEAVVELTVVFEA